MTQNKPALVAAAVVLLALCGGAAWYFLGDDRDPNLMVMVDGKEVDPSTIKSITGPDGKPLDLKLDLDNPHKLMSQTVDEFFALQTKAERDKFLDRMIDAQPALPRDVKVSEGAAGQMRVQMTAPPGAPGTQPAEGGEAPKTIMVRRTGGGGGDNMPPDLRAKVAEMASAMNKRRAERGLPPGPMGLMIVKKSDGNTTVTPK